MPKSKLNIAEQFKDEILVNKIDVCSMDYKRLAEWSKSNFVNVLYDNKIYIDSVILHSAHFTNLSAQKIKKKLGPFKYLFSISSETETNKYNLDFGIIKNIQDFKFLNNNNSIYVYETLDFTNLFSSSFFKKVLLEKKFNFTKINSKYLLIFYS